MRKVECVRSVGEREKTKKQKSKKVSHKSKTKQLVGQAPSAAPKSIDGLSILVNLVDQRTARKQEEEDKK